MPALPSESVCMSNVFPLHTRAVPRRPRTDACGLPHDYHHRVSPRVRCGKIAEIANYSVYLPLRPKDGRHEWRSPKRKETIAQNINNMQSTMFFSIFPFSSWPKIIDSERFVSGEKEGRTGIRLPALCASRKPLRTAPSPSHSRIHVPAPT